MDNKIDVSDYFSDSYFDLCMGTVMHCLSGWWKISDNKTEEEKKRWGLMRLRILFWEGKGCDYREIIYRLFCKNKKESLKMSDSELWDKRKAILYSIQNGKCGIENCTWDNCPLPENKRLKFSDEYISIDHKFQKCREGKSAERQQAMFGKMIDSLVNLRLVPNSCNVNRMGQARMSEQDAMRWEKILSMNLDLYGRSYADILNMKSDVPSDEVKAVLEEVQLIFKMESNNEQDL